MNENNFSEEIAFIESVSTENQDVFTKDQVAKMLYEYERIEYRFHIGQIVTHASFDRAPFNIGGLFDVASSRMLIIAAGFMGNTDSNDIIYMVSHLNKDGLVVRAYLIESELVACE